MSIQFPIVLSQNRQRRRVEVTEDTVKIIRKSGMFLSHKEISTPISQISQVKVTKSGSFLPGSIKFFTNNWNFEEISFADQTFNTKETAEDYRIALEMKAYIESYQSKSPSPASPPPSSNVDEIRKLKGLRDDGLITQEEFEAAKKKALGI